MNRIMITQPEKITESKLAPGCEPASWSPEVLDFYGDPATILRKIDGHDMELADRRIFVLLTESEGRANVRFFEQVDGENYAVSTWTGESLDGLNGRLAETIMTNKGVHCVGEQVRALLKSFDLELAATVPAPANARAAFAHTVREHV